MILKLTRHRFLPGETPFFCLATSVRLHAGQCAKRRGSPPDGKFPLLAPYRPAHCPARVATSFIKLHAPPRRPALPPPSSNSRRRLVDRLCHQLPLPASPRRPAMPPIAITSVVTSATVIKFSLWRKVCFFLSKEEFF